MVVYEGENGLVLLLLIQFVTAFTVYHPKEKHSNQYRYKKEMRYLFLSIPYKNSILKSLMMKIQGKLSL